MFAGCCRRWRLLWRRSRDDDRSRRNDNRRRVYSDRRCRRGGCGLARRVRRAGGVSLRESDSKRCRTASRRRKPKLQFSMSASYWFPYFSYDCSFSKGPVRSKGQGRVRCRVHFECYGALVTKIFETLACRGAYAIIASEVKLVRIMLWIAVAVSARPRSACSHSRAARNRACCGSSSPRSACTRSATASIRASSRPRARAR